MAVEGEDPEVLDVLRGYASPPVGSEPVTSVT